MDPPALRDPAGFLESVSLVPVELEPGGGVRHVGPQGVELLGFSRDVWLEGDFWSRVVVPDDQATVADARWNTLQARGRHEIDYRVERADGRVAWVSEYLSWAEDDEAGPLLRGFLWDVTGRKRQEVALWKSEERIRSLIRKAPDALILTDAGGSVLNMNDQAEALFDYSLSEIVGSGIEHLLPENLRPRLAELREAFERDPQRRSLVEGKAFTVQRSDGNQIPVEISLSRVSGDEEEGRILWAARDLTVRLRVEAQRRSGAKVAGAAVAPMSIAVDCDDRVVEADAVFAQWFGSSVGELRGRPAHDVLGRHLHEELRGAIRQARRGATASHRTQRAIGDRDPVPLEIAVAPRFGPDRAVTGYVLVVLPA